jgi:hypothetical protein
MSLTQKGRKLRSEFGKSLPRGSLFTEPDNPTFTFEMASLLKRAYGGRHSAVKVVAAAVGANERAVKNWFDGKNGPNGENLLRLVIHSDAMLAGFLAMAGKQDFVVGVELDRVTSALEGALREIRNLRPG